LRRVQLGRISGRWPGGGVSSVTSARGTARAWSRGYAGWTGGEPRRQWAGSGHARFHRLWMQAVRMSWAGW